MPSLPSGFNRRFQSPSARNEPTEGSSICVICGHLWHLRFSIPTCTERTHCPYTGPFPGATIHVALSLCRSGALVYSLLKIARNSYYIRVGCPPSPYP